ncbi:sulfatase-like hydrolase/transferase [Desulfovibrio sp. ZJ200]|uniref:sulfatase-like hydrolase/transferase n=1 Tax=Desulfovibrio sp. ZJ200 TaxID=2709792 RepID=UPI0013EA9255|nr:sulfatase-like hydrolase/transferase [Desulfovibrio sp. ZJ200]
MLHRVLPHLATLLLTLLMAGQSLLVQHLSGIDIRGLVLMDIAAALLLVMLCGRRLLRAICLLQALLSLLCLSYATVMGTPLSLTALINGSRQLAVMDLSSLLSYVGISSLLLILPFLGGQWWLCGRKPRLSRRWLALIPAVLLLVSHGNACLLQPPRHFSPEFLQKEGKRFFEPPSRRSLKYRGYVASMLLELGTGYALSAHYHSPAPCSARGTEAIPVPPVAERIALVQVECLDFELLEMQHGGQSVMPFLQSLLPHAILLRLDGAKKLASANSDFELFNGREASGDVVHYEYETSYPHSLITCLKQTGRQLDVFHGLPADFMNLRSAYQLQGFGRYHDIETMRQAGIRPLDCWWAGVINDSDLFAYATRQQHQKPWVQFIITMTMHLPEHLHLVTDRKLFADTPQSAFLTLAHHTDAALQRYVQALPDGAMLILWGDHSSYAGNNSGKIPFLV